MFEPAPSQPDDGGTFDVLAAIVTMAGGRCFEAVTGELDALHGETAFAPHAGAVDGAVPKLIGGDIRQRLLQILALDRPHAAACCSDGRNRSSDEHARPRSHSGMSAHGAY